MKSFTLAFGIIFSSIIFSQNLKAPVKVHVTNYKYENLKGEQVLFINQITKKTTKGITNHAGKFLVNLSVGKYDIKLKSIGKSENYSTIEIPKIGKNQTYIDMELDIKMSLPKFFTLDNLHFASGQATILKSSYKELAELVEYLKLKTDIKIEISGHTDSNGDELKNMALSIKRAKAINDYLLKRGVNPKRLIAKGYGETRPIADNLTPQGRAKNRRTEIRIL